MVNVFMYKISETSQYIHKKRMQNKKETTLPIINESNIWSGSKNALELLGFGVVVVGERSGGKRSDFDGQVWSRKLVKQSPHVVATHALSVGALSPDLATL